MTLAKTLPKRLLLAFVSVLALERTAIASAQALTKGQVAKAFGLARTPEPPTSTRTASCRHATSACR